MFYSRSILVPFALVTTMVVAEGTTSAQRVRTSGSNYVTLGHSVSQASVYAWSSMTAYRTSNYTNAGSRSRLRANAMLFYSPRTNIGYIDANVFTSKYGDSTTYRIDVAGDQVFSRRYSTGNTTRNHDNLVWWRDLYDRDPRWTVSVGGKFVTVYGNIGCWVDADVALGQSRGNYTRLSQKARVYGAVDARAVGFRVYARKKGRVCDTEISGHARAYAGGYPRVYGTMSHWMGRLDVLIRACRNIPFFWDPCGTLAKWTYGGSTATLVRS